MIVVECHLEKALIRLLGFGAVRHAANKPAVLAELMSYGITGQRAVGLVDEDPGATWPACFKRFRRLKGPEHGFSVWKGPGDVYLIMLHPLHEAWIYEVARRQGLDPCSCGLPPRWEAFHARIHAGRRPRERLMEPYARLVSELLARRCQALTSLKSELERLLRGEGEELGR